MCCFIVSTFVRSLAARSSFLCSFGLQKTLVFPLDYLFLAIFSFFRFFCYPRKVVKSSYSALKKDYFSVELMVCLRQPQTFSCGEVKKRKETKKFF